MRPRATALEQMFQPLRPLRPTSHSSAQARAKAMSYFICGFKTNTTVLNRFEQILTDIVPTQLRSDPLQISDSPYLTLYGHRKVIQHLAIHHRKVGSWLVIIGTPLVRLKS